VAGALAGVAMVTSISRSKPPARYAPPRSVLEVTDQDEFAQILMNNKVVLVDFYAGWCSPCRRLKPVIQELAEEYSGRVAVVIVNVDQAQPFIEEYRLLSIPDVRVFKNGKLQKRLVGALDKAPYTEALDSALG